MPKPARRRKFLPMLMAGPGLLKHFREGTAPKPLARKGSRLVKR